MPKIDINIYDCIICVDVIVSYFSHGTYFELL